MQDELHLVIEETGALAQQGHHQVQHLGAEQDLACLAGAWPVCPHRSKCTETGWQDWPIDGLYGREDASSVNTDESHHMCQPNVL